MCQRIQIASPDAWLSPDVQEEVLEHRAALLAKRHLDDAGRGKDTSYDVFELTMAHADLIYWRGLQAQINQGPEADKATLEALSNVVSILPSTQRRM